MKNLRDKVAVVTGAGSGIGRELARGLARKGCHLALNDIDADGLDETIGLLSGSGVKVTSHIVDVGNRDQVYQHAQEVVDAHGRVHLVFNNAGVGLGVLLEDVAYEDFEWIMGINFWGVVYGTKAYLPYLKQQPESHIINMSSINGFLTNPMNGPYCVTKFAIKGFTEALIQELQETPVRASVVCPGGIRTNIFRNARFHSSSVGISKGRVVRFFDKKMLKISSEEAARAIIRGVERNRQRIMVGQDAKILDWLCRLFPTGTSRWFANIHHKALENMQKEQA